MRGPSCLRALSFVLPTFFFFLSFAGCATLRWFITLRFLFTGGVRLVLSGLLLSNCPFSVRARAFNSSSSFTTLSLVRKRMESPKNPRSPYVLGPYFLTRTLCLIALRVTY